MTTKHKSTDNLYHLTPEQLKSLVNGAKTMRDRYILKVFILTGIRRQELSNIQIEDIDFDTKLLYIKQGKGDKSRHVPMSSDLANELKSFIGNKKSGCLFESQKGNKIDVKQINNIVAKAGHRANIATPNPNYKNVGPHLLRHSFARNWKKASGSIESLSKILGHSSIATTLDLYGNESIEDVQENYNDLIYQLL